MSEQQVQKKSLEEMNAEEEEPVFMTDREGIVLVWPDQHVQRFPWSVLRRLTVRNGVLTAIKEQSSHARMSTKRKE